MAGKGLLDTFLQGIEEKTVRIRQIKETRDMVNYIRAMKYLEACAYDLGYSNLYKLAFKHEYAAKKNDIAYIDAHFNELAMELSNVIARAREIKSDQAVTAVNESKDAIIVADDSIIIRTFVNKILSSEFDILQAVDGNQVIEIIEKNQDKNIVGLLLDLNMPNANGFTVLDYFKQNKLFDTIHVSLITGDDSKDSIDKVFQYPVVDMLNKPFSENDLRRIVERTISLHKTL